MNPVEISAILAALWLGLLSALSPCPLASNIAAIGFVSRVSQDRGFSRNWLPGLLYALGRALSYTVVGGVITRGILSAPVLSGFLQRNMNQLLGPLLVLVGMALLGMLPGLPSFGPATGKDRNEKLLALGLPGCFVIGFLFALAFCPVSAALFFGSLLPLSVKARSAWLLPSLFGIGSSAPVLVFAIALGIGRAQASQMLHQYQKLGQWIGPATGVLLILVGVWMCLHLTLRIV